MTLQKNTSTALPAGSRWSKLKHNITTEKKKPEETYINSLHNEKLKELSSCYPPHAVELMNSDALKPQKGSHKTSKLQTVVQNLAQKKKRKNLQSS